MMNCPACQNPLRPLLTKKGITVDACPSCKGAFFDDGELEMFSKKKELLRQQLSQGLIQPHSGRNCPRCRKPMEEGGLFESDLMIDRCAQCRGIFLDDGELMRLMEKLETSFQPDPVTTNRTPSPLPQTGGSPLRLLSLPNLALRTMMTLGLLYGILGAVLIILAEMGILQAGGAVLIGLVVILFQFMLGPWLMDLSLRWLYKARWVSDNELPPYLVKFVKELSARQGIKYPRMGLIDDGAPNAFTYGHTPNNARIVITRGILNLLSEQEVKAVVAHEMGHVVHWDMVLMTVAQMVPLILYFIYRTLIRIKSRGRDKSAGARMAIALGAYILYIISEYIVLWFSRTREYHADRFAGDVTGDPNALSQALVKIAYGLAGKGNAQSGQEQENRRPVAQGALAAMGIFDQKAALSLAVVSSAGGGVDSVSGSTTAINIDCDQVADAMKWDLWNPWAAFYEIHSTHPLVAHRIRYLSNQASSMGLQPFIEFNFTKPESYWDDFLFELGIYFLPVFCLIPGLVFALLTQVPSFFGLSVAGLGFGSLLKTLYSYRSGDFPRMSIAALLSQVKVSRVRPVPATVEGVVVGKGVPGLIWSEDFVIQDPTGILFLDYRQPLAVWNWIFGFMRAGEYQGKKIMARGWFRRAPVPYLEMREFVVDGQTRRLYSYPARLVWNILLIVGGFVAAVAI